MIYYTNQYQVTALNSQKIKPDIMKFNVRAQENAQQIRIKNTDENEQSNQENENSQYYQSNLSIVKNILSHLQRYPCYWLIFIATLALIYLISKSTIPPIEHQYCIVVTQQKAVKFDIIQNVMSQTFTDWKLYYYASKQTYQQKSNIAYSKDKLNRIRIIKSLGNEGKNFYDGVANKCSENAIIIMLEDGEKFNDQTSLQKIVQKFKNDTHTYFIATAISFNGTIYKPSQTLFSNFSRAKYYNQKSNTPQSNVEKIQVYLNISVHARAFKSDFYKLIMPFDILTLKQEFYENKISYLFPLLQMKSSKCTNLCLNQRTAFRVDYFSQMPDKIDFVNEVVIKSQNSFHLFDQQAFQIVKKMAYQSIERMFFFVEAVQMKTPKYWPSTFRDKKINLLNRNITKGKYEIPKKVHQIWVGDEPMSQLKQKLAAKLQKVYQGYQYRMWTNKDITRQNFPLTYDYLMRIIQIDKTYEFSRMSMVSDFMRWQIIYNHGGFYVDTNYEAFKTYEQFRHYPFISNCQGVSECLYFFVASPFGAPKGSPILARLLDKKNMDSIDLKGNSAIQSGPGYFSKCVTTQQYYYDIKILPPDITSPYLPWMKDDRFTKCKCRFEKQVPQQLKGGYTEVIEVKGQKTIFPCDIQYPNAYGIDHYYSGISWKDKKSTK